MLTNSQISWLSKWPFLCFAQLIRNQFLILFHKQKLDVFLSQSNFPSISFSGLIILLSSLSYRIILFCGVSDKDQPRQHGDIHPSKLGSQISGSLYEILLMWLGFFKEWMISLIFLEISLLSLSTTFFWYQLKLWSASQQRFAISLLSQLQFLIDLLCSSERDFKDCLDSPK